MNSIQRRLLRVFLQAGGDVTDAAQFDRFLRCVEGHIIILPPKVREAVELAWRQADSAPYKLIVASISEHHQQAPRLPALRQRVSRGARLLEDAIRGRFSVVGETNGPGRKGPRPTATGRFDGTRSRARSRAAPVRQR